LTAIDFADHRRYANSRHVRALSISLRKTKINSREGKARSTGSDASDQMEINVRFISLSDVRAIYVIIIERSSTPRLNNRCG